MEQGWWDLATGVGLGGAEGLGDFNCGGGAVTGGGDYLAEGVGAQVARDVEAGDGGLVGGAVVTADVTGGVIEVRGGGGKVGDAGSSGALANKNKHAGEGIEQVGGGFKMFADGDTPQGAELGDEVRFGLEGGMGDEGEGLDQGGEAEGFLNGGVTAADYGDVLTLGEVGVTEGAIGDGDGEGEGERARFGAGGEQNGAGADGFAVNGEFKAGGGGVRNRVGGSGGLSRGVIRGGGGGIGRWFKGADGGTFAVGDGGAGGFGLAAHGGGEVATGAGEAGIVTDLGDFAEGATDVGALKNANAETGAGGIEGGGEGGGTAADNGEV